MPHGENPIPRPQRKGSLTARTPEPSADAAPQDIRLDQAKVLDTQAVDEWLGAVIRRDREKFVQAFDLPSLRSQPLTDGQRDLLVQGIKSFLSTPQDVGLASYRIGAFECLEPFRNYRVRWSWPHARFSDECILAIFKEIPMSTVDPDKFMDFVRGGGTDPIWAAHYNRQTLMEAGAFPIVETEPQWAGYSVLVWSIIDLQFDTKQGRARFHTTPLLLGELPKPNAASSKSFVAKMRTRFGRMLKRKR
jgi:hypothetical protein